MEALANGEACEAATGDTDSQDCFGALALPTCQDCVGSWGEWGDCNRNCGTDGVQTREYTVSQEREVGGAECEAVDGQTDTPRECNTDACATVCTTPADLTGYNSPTETELTVQDGFAVTATCQDGYGNDAIEVVATACTENGQPYTLAGCEPAARPPPSPPAR